MKLKLSLINTLLLVGIFSYLIIGTIGNGNDEKEAYVITGELFNEFEYQKELDVEYQSLKKEKIQQLELLRQDVVFWEEKARKQSATEVDVATYQYKYNEFVQTEAVVNQELVEINNQYSVKIWDKLNSLVSQFGEEHNYEVIFGAGGSGTIMYAQEKKNITEELIAFCNSKYNGK